MAVTPGYEEAGPCGTSRMTAGAFVLGMPQ